MQYFLPSYLFFNNLPQLNNNYVNIIPDLNIYVKCQVPTHSNTTHCISLIDNNALNCKPQPNH